MSEHFGESALRLAALAAHALGWRPGEFWAATPCELASCLADPAGKPAGMTREDLSRLMEHDCND